MTVVLAFNQYSAVIKFRQLSNFDNGIQPEIKGTSFDSNGHIHFYFKAQTLNNCKMNILILKFENHDTFEPFEK